MRAAWRVALLCQVTPAVAARLGIADTAVAAQPPRPAAVAPAWTSPPQRFALRVQGSGYSRQLINHGERAVSFNTSGPLVSAANARTRFLLPRTERFLSWVHPTAIFKASRRPEAAKLHVSCLLSPERQGGGTAWSVHRDMPLPTGYGPLSQYNTSPVGFRDWTRGRARLEKLRDMLQQALGPKLDPNPTGVQGISPEGRP